ncbi:MAG: hypothetical protein E2O75_05580 [Chloroflexi bacterium]|nr:MAG: hypothetical protein E2O75_05580 [Chloroflexota bacterium]
MDSLRAQRINRIVHAIIFCLLASATSVHATLIVAEPDDFAAGTDLTTMFLNTLRDKPSPTQWARSSDTSVKATDLNSNPTR